MTTTTTTLEDSLRAATTAALPDYSVALFHASPRDLKDKCVAFVSISFEARAVRIAYDPTADPDRVLTAVARSFHVADQWQGQAYALTGKESAE